MNHLHTTQKITYLLVLMQLHLNPSYKGNQSDIFVTQCVSDLICPHTYRWYRIHIVSIVIYIFILHWFYLSRQIALAG